MHRFAPAPGLPVDVLVPTGSRYKRAGIRTHRSSTLAPHDYGTLDGIAMVSAARAILGVAETATLSQLEALIAAAHAARAVTEQELEDVITRAGPRACARKLARVLSDQSGMTLSEAERILRRLLKAAGLAQPIAGYQIGRYKADFALPEYWLIVEFDSWVPHGHRKGFRHDRTRNAWRAAKGWTVLPVIDEMLRDQPFAVVARITEALTRRETPPRTTAARPPPARGAASPAPRRTSAAS